MSTLGLGATLKCGSYVVNEIMTKSDNTVKINDDSVAVKNYISNTVYENDVFLLFFLLFLLHSLKDYLYEIHIKRENLCF